jgi:aminopeptidase
LKKLKASVTTIYIKEKTMDKRFDKYCELVVKNGVNIQKNQTLFITAAVESAPMVRMVTEKAYAAGAGNVIVQWEDEQVEKVRYLNNSIEKYKKMEPWKKLQSDTMCERGAAFMRIVSSTPEIYKDVGVDKLVENTKATSEGTKVYRKMQSTGKLQWCGCAAASEGWAKKVFPNEKDTKAAVDKLWDAIFSCSRVNNKDVFENWKVHEADLKKRVAVLMKHDFKTLVYKNSLGTELELGLPEGHIWSCATSFKSASGVKYMPNIPTEEVFTAPDRNRIEGVVYSSKPFMYLGTAIEEFAVWFKAGKVVKVKAKKNQEALEKLVSSFKNSDRLGEVALVPYNSPISESGILFLNTLYDENASCHLAFGRGSPNWVKNTEGKSDAELMKMGINLSTTHNDFMIGTKDLSITGIKKNGKSVDVFKNGNFAF